MKATLCAFLLLAVSSVHAGEKGDYRQLMTFTTVISSEGFGPMFKGEIETKLAKVSAEFGEIGQNREIGGALVTKELKGTSEIPILIRAGYESTPQINRTLVSAGVHRPHKGGFTEIAVLPISGSRIRNIESGQKTAAGIDIVANQSFGRIVELEAAVRSSLLYSGEGHDLQASLKVKRRIGETSFSIAIEGVTERGGRKRAGQWDESSGETLMFRVMKAL